MREVLYPLGAFGLAQFLLAIAAITAGYAPFDPALFARWDSGQYLGIARHGYDLVECSRIGYAPSGWCGNAGWMPGYPALIALAVRLGARPAAAAVAITAGFEIALLALLWKGFLARRNQLALLACALAPGAVYFHAVFPISMCAFFIALCLWLLLRDRFALAGLAGAAAAASYSTGFLLAPIGAVWGLARPGGAGKRIGRAAAAGGIAAAGVVAVFVLQHATVGAWDAFLRVQAKYDHRAVSPLSTLVQAWATAPRPASVQSIAVACGMVAIALFRALRGFRSRDALLLGCAAAFWLFPLSLANVSLTRSEALVFPALVLLDDAPPAACACACAVLAALAWPIAQLFYRGVLV
jgi:hypothetical protein